VAVAIAAPLAAILLWGRFTAPRSRQRLPAPTRVLFELAVFRLAALAPAASGSFIAAAVFAAVVLLNAALLTLFGQWAS
jgi:hypothetical protein